MTGTVRTPDDPVEEYLDRLLVSLSGSPRKIRHTLAEVEAHLRDVVAEGLAIGLTQEQAQVQAVERLGPVESVTGRAGVLTRPSRALARRVTLTGVLVGAVGGIALGGSAIIAWVLAQTRGNEFLTAPWPKGTYTHADCAGWLAGDPRTHSCVTAMLADHAFDTVRNAIAGGILGVIALAVYLVLRRRWQDRATMAALPAGSAQALGAALAALVAVICYGQSFDIETVQRGVGVGTPLSLAIAATVAAAGFAVSLRQAVAGHQAARSSSSSSISP